MEQKKTPPAVQKAMHKYIQTDKGKKTRQKWVKKNQEKIQEYQTQYRKKRRQRAIDKGLCLRCYKRKKMKHYSTCTECHTKNLRDSRERRKNK